MNLLSTKIRSGGSGWVFVHRFVEIFGFWTVEVETKKKHGENPQVWGILVRAKISMYIYPPRELTYPTWGKGKSSSKVPWYGIC